MTTDFVGTAVHTALSPLGLDADASDYISSLLAEDSSDADAREAAKALILGSADDEDAAEEAIASLFQALDVGGGGEGGGSGPSGSTEEKKSDGEPVLRRLGSAVTMKEQDVQTFASGLEAASDGAVGVATASEGSTSDIQSFYANMIDASSHPRAKSERERRKARQRALREAMEEEERRRAIEDAAASLVDDDDDDGGGNAGEDVTRNDDGHHRMAADASRDNAVDVRLSSFSLPNKRGGGPDLLTDATLILAAGRRYGLMGRNGCGKTTFLTALAARELGGGGSGGRRGKGGGRDGSVPQKMSMLLVRQEIVGTEMSAVETVLKSDVLREGVKRLIVRLEEELDALEKSGSAAMVGTEADTDTQVSRRNGDAEVKRGIEAKESKGKQRLRERKKGNKAAKRQDRSVAKLPSAANKAATSGVEERRARLASCLSRAYARLAQIEEEEGGDPEPRARKVLAGLGFVTKEMQDKPTKQLSGGWRMRVSLSCALFADPSLLLLDEPTNHLDLEAVLWLERYLTTKFQGTLVVVSHDRHFLNEVVTDVVHFHRNTLTTYRGDISNFEQVREENKQRQIRLRETQEAKRQHLQKYIDLHAQAGENGVKAAKQRKSRMKKLDKLGVMAQEGRRYKASYDGDAQEVEEYVDDEEVTLTFPDPGKFDGDVVRLERVTFGYNPEKVLLNDVDLSIDSKSRVALLGRNGCGKSTLIKLVVGALQPLKGKASIDGRAKIEYLAQHQLEQLDPDSTPMQTMLERYPGDQGNAHKIELRRYLANFGLGGEVLPLQKIHTMSGGQKCRLCLACAMYRKPHMLILDEPTNHLDLETTAALIKAIRNFQGGVLLVSHDQHLLTSVCKHLYVVENGSVEKLRQGTTNGEAFEAYKKAVVQGRR